MTKMPINNFWNIKLKQSLMYFDLKHLAAFTLLLLANGFAGIAKADYVIGVDDALQIKVYGYEDLTVETRVSGDGRITYPLIGEVAVGGKSIAETETKIAGLLTGGGFIKAPQVSVSVLEYKSLQVSVLGQVNKPGLYPLDSQSTLIDVIAMAGGVSQLGEDRAVITRHKDNKTVKQEVDLRQALENPGNVNLLAVEKGDVIYVPKASMFYIQGEVQRPGAYRLEPRMTIAQALSLGGGLTLRGTTNGVAIQRSVENDAPKTLDAELTDAVLKDDVVVFEERLF